MRGEMRAAVLDKAGPPEALYLRTVPVPRLTRGHVIIELDYASVGSWDAKLRSGAWGEIEPGTILGSDGSGTIAQAAADVQRLSAGGVEPEPAFEGHKAISFDGEMSRDAFERLNIAIGSRTIPLRVQAFPLDEIVEAHRRIEKGHVVGGLTPCQ